MRCANGEAGQQPLGCKQGVVLNETAPIGAVIEKYSQGVSICLPTPYWNRQLFGDTRLLRVHLEIIKRNKKERTINTKLDKPSANNIDKSGAYEQTVI
jgi:hypothetical protein